MIEVGSAIYSGCDSCGSMVDVKIIDIRMDDTEEYDPDGFEPVTFALCVRCRQELAKLVI
jgi:hypothetical protein